MSARMRDVDTPGSARFAQAAIARVGQAIALAVGDVVQALFEAVLPQGPISTRETTVVISRRGDEPRRERAECARTRLR